MILADAYSARRRFCPTGHWYLDDSELNVQQFDVNEFMNDEDDNGDGEGDDDANDDDESRDSSEEFYRNASGQSVILRQIPFLIPFVDRVQLLRQLISHRERRCYICASF